MLSISNIIIELILQYASQELCKPMLITVAFTLLFISQFIIISNMATQREIDELLNDQWGDESSRISNGIIKQSKVSQSGDYPENSYANQNFQDYEESRRTQSIQQSHSQLPPNKIDLTKKKQKQKEKNFQELTSIKQQVHKSNDKKINENADNKKTQIYIKPALQLQNERPSSRNQNKSNSKITIDKAHLPHNFARLQHRQKQLLLTSLTEENKALKAKLRDKQVNIKDIETKYKMLLEEKSQNTSTTKELALQKQVSYLKTKLEQVIQLQKMTEQRNKYKTKMSKNPGNFIPEEESNKRESQLLDLIDKLKQRLLESDQNMIVLQKKLNQGSQHNDDLLRKMKRVQQLEYKIEKMTEQAETDRGFIQILKDKIKGLEDQVEAEKSKYRKLEIETKRMQIGQLNHSDITKQLQEVRREKQLLQKSLKQISSTMMNNVRKNYQNPPGSRIEDSAELLRAHDR